MRVFVEIVAGPGTGKKATFKSGQIIQAGRTSWAELSVPSDGTMSGMHFSLECGRDKCRLRDLGSTNGTTVNGVRVSEVDLKDGDQITAGQSTFVIRYEGGSAVLTLPPAPAQPARESLPATRIIYPPDSARDLLEILRGEAQPLYTVLDAARTRRIVELLRSSKEEQQTLYEGDRGKALADYGPHLIRLLPDSKLLEELVWEGWGKAWGIYLNSQLPFAEIRKHLRRFLRIELEGQGQVYFRFYDPRVLRSLLPAFHPEQVEDFFGPISAYLMEARDAASMMIFRVQRSKLSQTAIKLKSPGPRAEAASPA